MSLLDTLLQTDLGILENTKEYEMEIPRLTRALGKPFILTLAPVNAETYMQLQGRMVDVVKGKVKDLDIYNFYLHLLVEGITNKEFNDPKVLSRFKAATPLEVYKKLFNAGEITRIATKISSMSGYDEEENETAIKEIKNS